LSGQIFSCGALVTEAMPVVGVYSQSFTDVLERLGWRFSMVLDVALYAMPHHIDETIVAFIMNERLSHKNLTSNPKAVYLFLEKGSGYNGKSHKGDSHD
jgi:hypothetical protein